MKKIKRQTILLLFTLLSVFVSISAVSADNLTVGSNGTYLNISSAVNAANDGDTIIIANGTYTGDNNRGIDIQKNLTITGESQNGTIIDADHTGYIFYIGTGYNVTISKLTLRDGGDVSYGALINEGNCFVNSCTFVSNNGGSGGAIYGSEGQLTIKDCIFANNSADRGGAIYYYGGNITITGSTFTDNSADRGGAMYLDNGEFTITGCNFNKNTAEYGGAIYGDDDIDLVVKYSRFVGNTAETLGQDIYKYYGEYTFDARYNWWGSINGPAAGRIAQNEGTPNSEIYTPWLVMNIDPADPSTIYTGETSKISVNVYTDFNGVDHSVNADLFFSGPQLTFTTDLGNVGSNSITVPWTFGMATATLRGDEGPGIATVIATDVQTRSTTVTILQGPNGNPNGSKQVNAASNTVEMQETGIPIVGLILAVLILFSGLITSKKK